MEMDEIWKKTELEEHEAVTEAGTFKQTFSESKTVTVDKMNEDVNGMAEDAADDNWDRNFEKINENMTADGLDEAKRTCTHVIRLSTVERIQPNLLLRKGLNTFLRIQSMSFIYCGEFIVWNLIKNVDQYIITGKVSCGRKL